MTETTTATGSAGPPSCPITSRRTRSTGSVAGLQAVWSAAMQMRWGGVDLAPAGGNESMTRMPFYDFGARAGYRALVDGTVMMLTDPFHGIHMGETAELVAEKFAVSREEQDEFALLSQQRAATPQAKAAFGEEIVPVEVGGRKPVTVTEDEHPRPGTTLETLERLADAYVEKSAVFTELESAIFAVVEGTTASDVAH